MSKVLCPVVEWHGRFYVVLSTIALRVGPQILEVVDVSNEPWIRRHSQSLMMPAVTVEWAEGSTAIIRGYDRQLHQLPIVDIGVQVTPEEIWDQDAFQLYPVAA